MPITIFVHFLQTGALYIYKNSLYVNKLFEIYIAFFSQFVACLITLVMVLPLLFLVIRKVLDIYIILVINISLYLQCSVEELKILNHIGKV